MAEQGEAEVKVKYPVIDGNKVCGGCGLFLPVSMFRPARKHLSSRCVDCLRAYAAAYRARPEVKAKMSSYSKARAQDPALREQKNAYARVWRKSATAKGPRNVARRAWAAREKQKAVDYKGGACQVCGYSKCLAAMDFHHYDPREKDGIKAHWTFERNRPELDKCALLCCRCHREVHAGEVVL